jgi:hypothetical protein
MAVMGIAFYFFLLFFIESYSRKSATGSSWTTAEPQGPIRGVFLYLAHFLASLFVSSSWQFVIQSFQATSP